MRLKSLTRLAVQTMAALSSPSKDSVAILFTLAKKTYGWTKGKAVLRVKKRSTPPATSEIAKTFGVGKTPRWLADALIGEKTIQLDEDKLDLLLYTMKATFGVIGVCTFLGNVEYYQLIISPKNGLQ